MDEDEVYDLVHKYVMRWYNQVVRGKGNPTMRMVSSKNEGDEIACKVYLCEPAFGRHEFSVWISAVDGKLTNGPV